MWPAMLSSLTWLALGRFDAAMPKPMPGWRMNQPQPMVTIPTISAGSSVGCMAQPGLVTVAETGGAALFVLRPGEDGVFTGAPETILQGTYGRLSAAALAPDGLLWLGTVNKDGDTPVPTDDRVIRIQPPAGGGESRA